MAKLKRYHLVIDAQVYEQVAAGGARHQGTFVSEVRRALKLWVMVRAGEVETMNSASERNVLPWSARRTASGLTMG